jgi:hypothetical protein
MKTTLVPIGGSHSDRPSSHQRWRPRCCRVHNGATDAVDDTATQFKWHGIASETQLAAATARDILEHLTERLNR